MLNKISINILIWFLIATSSAYVSSYIAENIDGTDFPVFYTTANRVISPQYSMDVIYQRIDQEALPEKNLPENYFIYSPIASLLFAPLSLLSYFPAKHLLIFINIMGYFVAIALILVKLGQYRLSPFLLATTFTWMPFVNNSCGVQVNSIILLLIVAAIHFASQKKHLLSGGSLGVAGLIKIFPLAIALTIGVYHRKILIACIGIFMLAMCTPGTMLWLKTMQTVSSGHTPVYLYLHQYGLILFLSYAIAIVIFSLLCMHKSGTDDLLLIFAYSISVAFTVMPVVEYHHLTILSLTYIFIFFSTKPLTHKKILVTVSVLTSLHINFAMLFDFLPNTYWSVLLTWFSFSVVLYSGRETYKNTQPQVIQNRL